MAAALTLPTNVKVGEALVVTGTGFALTHAFTVEVTSNGHHSVSFAGTTSGAGAVTTASLLTITPVSPGLIHISVSDGTSTVEGTVHVWTS